MEILQGKLQATEAKRAELQKQLDEVEGERDDEIKIIQDVSMRNPLLITEDTFETHHRQIIFLSNYITNSVSTRIGLTN